MGILCVDTFDHSRSKVTFSATINADDFCICSEQWILSERTILRLVRKKNNPLKNLVKCIFLGNFSITAEDDFYNSGNISANTFNIIAKNIFLLNSKVASDSADISLTGDSSFRAKSGKTKN